MLMKSTAQTKIEANINPFDEVKLFMQHLTYS
ncbi:hypothetical protein NTGBS_1200004 [Candidatus Nitrotoga sp. BS]|nr:hypothetical protein NTGBS_1200004 [Candidatus Nitrotoga sp. BS]